MLISLDAILAIVVAKVRMLLVRRRKKNSHLVSLSRKKMIILPLNFDKNLSSKSYQIFKKILKILRKKKRTFIDNGFSFFFFFLIIPHSHFVRRETLTLLDRGECPKKKKLGQEIGKAAAEKSRGLFRLFDENIMSNLL